MTGDDYAALEARVTGLERQVRDQMTSDQAILTALAAQHEIATQHLGLIVDIINAAESLRGSITEHGKVLDQILRGLNELAAPGPTE